jgi:hypothetical protein
MPEDIEVSMEMVAAALEFINEKHDGESIPMAQLLHEGYVVMEVIRRKRIALDREAAIARAISGAVGHA